MSDQQRKPTLGGSETITPGVSGQRVDLNEMAEEELARTGQTGVAPTLGPNSVIHAGDQHLEEAPAAPAPAQQGASEQASPALGINVPHATDEEARKVLDLMKEKLGVKRVEPVDVTAGGIRFTLVKLSDKDAEWAMSQSTETVSHRTAAMGSLKTALTAIAVRGINGVPTYKVVGLELPKDSRNVPQVVEDPMFPPMEVRFAAAARLLQMFREDFDDSVCPAVYAFYNTHIEEKTEVKVELDVPFSKKSSKKDETTNSTSSDGS
jgi:hypothetical protein